MQTPKVQETTKPHYEQLIPVGERTETFDASLIKRALEMERGEGKKTPPKTA